MSGFEPVTDEQRRNDAVRPTHADSEAALITRRISGECDRFHNDSEGAECANGSCQCWCHT